MPATLYTSYHIPKMYRQNIQNTGKSNKLLSVMTVCRHGFHNGAMAYMLQFGSSANHRIFVAWVVFESNIFMLKSQT